MGGDPVKPVRPWDVLDPRQPRSPKVIAEGRLDICQNCDDYMPITRQCGRCWCVMPIKVHLANAECPVGKWGMWVSADEGGDDAPSL